MIKQMHMQLPAQQDTAYPITIGADLITHIDQYLPQHWQAKRLVIITDDSVNQLYSHRLLKALADYQPHLLTITPGETSKNYQTKHELELQMLQQHCNRDTLVLALGGGVVGDIAGYVAATYMRGVSYVQIPTSMLAMVDSSIGGKTGINTAHGKNLIGAFWQPSAVVVDINCLKTLPKTHFINGLIEALKMFMTNDRDYFDTANHQLDGLLKQDEKILINVIERAIQIKIAIVSQDEKENNQRMIVNFGHTIGHALEKVTDYTLLHGYAVALGILVEAKISQLLGYLSNTEYQAIEVLLLKLNISGQQLKAMNIEEIIQATKTDKKVKANNVRYVLLEKIGKVVQENNMYAHPVSDDIVKQALIAVSEV